MNFNWNRILAILTFLFSITEIQSQITVQSPNGWTPQEFVGNVLVLPPQISGVYISNCKFNNSTAPLPNSTVSKIGMFTNGPNFTDFPISNGIVMTTGGIMAAVGPNNNEGRTVPIDDGTIDSNLQSLTTFPIKNMSKLEFDFVSRSGDIQFEYIFASEEYPEYVCSDYNDVFGFFVTGPDPITGINTTWNIALMPGTTLPVTINSVNSGIPGLFSNGSNCDGPNQSLSFSSFYYSTSSGNTGIQFDGFTVIPFNSPFAHNNQRSGLFAKTKVEACVPYHMKLAIGNVSDTLNDSGVFIKSNGFTAPMIEMEHHYTLNVTDTLIKFCNSDTVTFTLSRRDPSRIYAFNVSTNIIPNPGVEIGQDYEIYYWNSTINQFTPLNTNQATFYIPEDSLSTQMIVRVPETANFASGEVKILKLQISMETCSFESPRIDTLTYYLRDNKPIVILDQLINTCEPLTSIEVIEIGGGYIENISWNPPTYLNNPDSLQTNCNITDSIVYTVIVNDNISCFIDTAFITVNYFSTPIASFTTDEVSGCAPLKVRFKSTTTPEFASNMYLISNMFGTVIDTIYGETFYYTFQNPGFYNVSLYANIPIVDGCEDWLIQENFINVSEKPNVNFSFIPLEPTNEHQVDFSNESINEGIVSYYWSFGDGNTSNSENPIHTYYVTHDETFNVLFRVTNQYNCAHDTIKQITVINNYAFFVPNAFTPNNDGNNDLFLPRVEDVLKYHLIIYNRYGEAIFQTINPDEPWDGTHKFEKCPAGVYTWVITYRKYAEPDTELRKNGTVTLVR